MWGFQSQPWPQGWAQGSLERLLSPRHTSGEVVPEMGTGINGIEEQISMAFLSQWLLQSWVRQPLRGYKEESKITLAGL